MDVPVNRYVGGCFWWYFREDIMPQTQPLFAVLAASW